MNPVDKLLAAYLAFVTVMAAARGGLDEPTTWWIVLAHALFGLLLYLFTRLTPENRAGQFIHDLYPLLLLPALYTEIGLVNEVFGIDRVFQNDALVQRWEAALFGGQVSYTWIRTFPSVFWSGLLHVAYVSYYPIVYLGPIILVFRGRRDRARRVLLATMTAYVVCYVVFIAFPVAGPNWVFDHPTGPVRDVWSARMVYALLAGGSSVGAAFPSSHVAATMAAVAALWWEWRTLFAVFVVPATLMTIATVYCQMHYAIDATLGLLIGVGSAGVARRIKP